MKKVAIRAALEAGNILTEHLGKIKNIEEKRPSDYVTEVDRLAEKKIIETIHKRFPLHFILCEESGEVGKKSNYKWIVDPLDGTTNYIHALQFFCVSIGLEKNGEVILGVLYAPALGELYLAEKGKGAYLYTLPFLLKKAQTKHLKKRKKLKVSETPPSQESFLVTGFSYNKEKNTTIELETFKKFLKVGTVRRLGSAALDLCYVARGVFDGFWERSLKPWDTAAAALVVKEAGGRVTNFSNKPFDLYKPEIVATNGLIHSLMLKKI